VSSQNFPGLGWIETVSLRRCKFDRATAPWAQLDEPFFIAKDRWRAAGWHPVGRDSAGIVVDSSIGVFAETRKGARRGSGI